MATWRAENSMLTQRGIEILNKIKAGVGSVTVTRVVSGSGRVAESLLLTQTKVSGVQKQMVLADRSISETGSVISVYISNEDFTAPYNLHQIGVYVTHPDYEGEQLYHIAQCDANDFDSIPLLEDNPVTYGYNLYLEHGNSSESMHITVDQTGLITRAEFEHYKGTVSAPNLFDNWYFANPVDRRYGFIVPKGTVMYSKPELTTQSGTVSDEYVKAYYMNTSYGFVKSSNGNISYVKYSDMMRGYVGSGYGIERWRSNNPNNHYLIKPDGLHFTMYAGARFYQTVFLPAGTYTFSVLAEVVGESRLGIEAPVGVFTPLETGVTFATFTIAEPQSVNLYISSENDGTAILKAVKLEVGSQQTLAYKDFFGNWILNEVPSQATEASKCSQYDVTVIANTDIEITSAILGWIAGMSDHQIKNFVLSVETLGLGLGGGAWFITINRTSATYATVQATRYDLSGMLIKVRSMNDGVLTGWATATSTPVFDAVLE